MAYNPIDLGSAANDGTGDTLRAAGEKINAQLSEIYTDKASLSADQTFTGKQALEDDASATEPVLRFEHYGAGSTSAYGMDFANYPNAKSAVVVHQYSNADPAVQLDNTDTQPLVLLRNTNNPTKNPGGASAGQSATGDFLKCVNTSGSNYLRVLGRGEILMTPGSDAAGNGIEVVGNASSSRRLIKATMNGTGHGVEIVGAVGSAGFYPLLVNGYDYGPSFATTQDGSGRTVLLLTKNGTGLGTGLRVVNKGTGNSVEIATNSATVFSITAAGLPRWQAASNEQTTVGAAGAASALPATPTKYLKVVDSAGTTYVIPAYAAS